MFALFTLAANLVHPVTPTFIVERQLDSSMFGVALAAMMTMNFAFAPFWGKLCSYIPTKIVMLIGGVGYGVGQFFFLMSTTEALVIAGRMFAGAFCGGVFTAFSNYIINTTTDPLQRAENLTTQVTIQNVASAVGYFVGGMLGMITTMANINNIAPLVGMWVEEGGDALNAVLRAGRGGVLAVIFGVLLMAKVEKWVRSKMPDSLDIVVSPLVIMFVCVIPYVFVIMPITGLISNGLVSVVGAVCMSESIFVRMIAGFLGSFLFLPLVAMGMHHGLVALYTVQLETIGFVTLYPALAMAGAGQVGAAIAIWLKARRTGNKRMMSVIGGALPAGVLGVGEPLIYGVTLPMGKPFITAGLGAGFGGMFCMIFKVAATTWGPSGILALPIMIAGGDSAVVQMICYAIGLVISYIMGFIITNFTLKDSEVANA